MKPTFNLIKTASAFFFILFLNSASNAQEISLRLKATNNYGPYYVEDTDTNSMKITVRNLTSTSITGVLSFQMYKDQSLLAELKQANRPSVTVGGYASQLVSFFNASDDLSEIDFYDQGFKDQFLTGSLLFDSTYSIGATFSYTFDNTPLVKDTLLNVSNFVPVPKISFVTIENDTLSIQASEIDVVWQQVYFQDQRQQIYHLKIYQVFSGQTDSIALAINTPVIDSIIDTCQSRFTWQRGYVDKQIIIDTVNVPFERFIVTVESVLGTGETNPLWNNLGVLPLNFTVIAYPWLNSIYDTLPFYHEGIRWGFAEETYGDSVFPPPDFYIEDAPDAPNASCATGNPDQNDFSGWDGFVGYHYPTYVSFNISGINYNPADEPGSHHFIVNRLNGFGSVILDPTTGMFPQVSPAGGDYAFRIGNRKSGTQAAALVYNITVNQNNSNIKFLYAVVLEGSHGNDPSNRPFFQVHVYDNTTNQVFILLKITPDLNNPFLKANNSYFYQEWTCVPLDLSAFEGHDLKIVFSAADCTKKDHLGYAYVDLLCDDNTVEANLSLNGGTFCLGDDIIANASASTFEQDHFWKIEECDANGNVVNGTDKIQYYFSYPASVMNIDLLYSYLGGTWKCNQYYKITVGVRGPCENGWDTESAVIYINPCFVADAGPNMTICSSQSTTIGHTYSPSPPSNVTFSWSPTTSLGSPTSSATSASPTNTTQYILTTNNGSGGCSSVDTVMVYVQTNSDFTIESGKTFCQRALWIVPNFQGEYTVTWTAPGETTTYEKFRIVSPSVSTTYTATITNACGTTVKTITVPAINLDMYYPYKLFEINGIPYTNSDYTFQYGSSFNPSSNIDVLKKFYILDTRHGTDISSTTVPSYHATAFRLTIINGYGQTVRTIEPALPDEGFQNGAINWDGKMVSGGWAQQDLYSWQLRLKNCRHTGWWQYQKTERRRVPLGPIPFVYYKKDFTIIEFPVLLTY